MQLLKPEEVKKDYDKSFAEKTDRVRKLNEAENEAIKNFNNTKIRVESEIKRLNSELEEYATKISEQKKVLTQEVETLESRRRDALKPINETREEAEKMFADAKEKEVDVARREDVVINLKESLLEKIENLKDAEESNKEKSAELDVREQKIKKAEEELKISFNNLQKRWTEYHKSLSEANQMFERRGKELQAEKIIVDSQRIANEVERNRLLGKQKELVSNYKALEQAKIHLGIK